MKKKLTLFATMLAVLAALTACGDDDNDGQQTHTAANGAEFNDADVEFASDMIQHHAQALQMVDLTMGRELDPEVRQLAEDIQMAQGPEIEQLTGWLTDWDQPIPETVRDHANAHGDMDDMDDMGSDMPGMMSAEQMSELEDATGEEFQQMWLEMMIEHHEGAIEMARAEQEDGHFSKAIELAEQIESAQEAEITHMQGLLAS